MKVYFGSINEGLGAHEYPKNTKYEVENGTLHVFTGLELVALYAKDIWRFVK